MSTSRAHRTLNLRPSEEYLEEEQATKDAFKGIRPQRRNSVATDTDFSWIEPLSRIHVQNNQFERTLQLIPRGTLPWPEIGRQLDALHSKREQIGSMPEANRLLNRLPLEPKQYQRLLSALLPTDDDDWVQQLITRVRPDAARRTAIVDTLRYPRNLRHVWDSIEALSDDVLEAKVYRSLLQEFVALRRGEE
ncbi:unnamed protein product [Penicillium bialowiezense]